MVLSGTEVAAGESTERAIGGGEYIRGFSARKAHPGLSARIRIDLNSRSRSWLRGERVRGPP
jgi:hypothetical protein